MTEKEKKEKKEKIVDFSFLEKKKILKVSVKGATGEEDVTYAMDRVRGLEKEYGKGLKVMVNIGKTDPFGRSSQFRNKVARELGDITEDLDIVKIAICSANVFSRTITSFVVAASRKKNIKVFSEEEEAMAWLEE